MPFATPLRRYAPRADAYFFAFDARQLSLDAATLLRYGRCYAAVHHIHADDAMPPCPLLLYADATRVY